MTKSILSSTRKRLSMRHRPFSTHKTLSKKHIPFSTRKKIPRDRLSKPKLFKHSKSKKNIHKRLDTGLVSDALVSDTAPGLVSDTATGLVYDSAPGLVSDALVSDALVSDALVSDTATGLVPDSAPVDPELVTQKKKKYASKTIGKFMKNTKEKRISQFLKVVCSDSGACLAVGTEIKRINQFFNHYTDFAYAINPVKSIGAPSANGFIKEITYRRDGYMSYAIFKSSITHYSDNLMYEYEVGQYINQQNKFFSCFLETYGLYMYNSVPVWNYFKDTKLTHVDSLSRHTTVIPDIDYIKGCRDAKYIAILIQHINNAISFDEFIRHALAEPNLVKRKYELNIDVFYILYQIYFVLDVLKDEFTHYDLHTGNVLLYEPVKNGYITYHYHLKSGETVEFQSKFIAKIIDYGRCYYHESDVHNSKNTYDRICKIDACKPECGKNVGFEILGPEKFPGSFYHISSQVRNKSHDLRLANMVKAHLLSSNSVIHVNKELLQRIVYKHRFGTPERENGDPYTIHNVSDIRAMLEHIVLAESFKEENVRYNASFFKIGDMHMYEDRRPMEYVKIMRVE